MAEKKIYIKNKRASHDFEFVDSYTAGIILTGTEIKSIRLGKVSLVDSFCFFINGELWTKGIHIAEYSYGSYSNHLPTRDRKLLLNKRELAKLQSKLKNKGFTIVVTSLFINDRGLAKLKISLARGKKDFDKRQDLKNKDAKRELDRVKKVY